MITLEISQRDIDLAHKCRILRNKSKAKGFQGLVSMSCPIANAARRKFHNEAQVSGNLKITKNVKGKYFTRYFGLTASAKALIVAFDSGKEIFPTAVHLTEWAK